MTSLWDLLKAYQLYGWTAFLLALFLMPLAMRIARRFRVMDYPDTYLKPHAKPTPYLGGTAICVAWASALILALIWGVVEWPRLLPLLLGGLAMSALGLVDDVRGVSPKMRLLVGAVVVLAVLIAAEAGWRLLDSVTVPVAAFSEYWFGVHLPAVPRVISVPVSLFTSVFIVLGACNSTNLIDGLDGLCGGVTGIISLGFFLLASRLALWGYSPANDSVRLVLAIAMFGAALGFLPWNFNPARIFMGDAGSVLLGFNCGMLIVLFAEKGIARWMIGALMIFALPVFDTALAMFRRWRSGRSIFEGDRSHFYDQLVQRGCSVRQSVLICYGLTVLFGSIGLLVTWIGENGPVIRTRYAVPLYLAVCVAAGLAAHLAGLTHPEEKQAQGAARSGAGDSAQ
jgi:UDP-GlcNAc:undecaprenyl-phosphate/decaprenyl-phosphate GlcNAc-1-phosphate transferase